MPSPPTPICSPVDLWAHIFPLLWLWVSWEPNRGTVPSRCLNNLYKGWQRNLVNSAYPSCNRIAIFFVLKATKTSGGGGRRPEGHRPSSPSPREKQGKAPRLDRASEGSASPAWDGERGPSPAWSLLAPPPPELWSNSWPGGRRGLVSLSLGFRIWAMG